MKRLTNWARQNLLPTARYAKHKFMPRRSYAQANEDLAIQSIFGKVERFIDIGAFDGVNLSNTFLFALAGARGLCFEPLPNVSHDLQRLYRFNNKITVIREGISDREATLTMRADGVMSAILETENLEHQEDATGERERVDRIVEIAVRPLNYWLDRYPEFQETDFISVDVEGHEANVLTSIDYSTLRTKCFIVETPGMFDGDPRDGYRQHFDRIDSILHPAGYVAKIIGPHNSFWIRKDLLDDGRIEAAITTYPQSLKHAA